MTPRIGKPAIAISISILLFGMCAFGCSDSNRPAFGSQTQAKASSALLLQISLRKQQIDSPSPERLSQMQSMGMNTNNLALQRIFIYLQEKLTQNQTNELQAITIKIYPDSWIPPVANQPNGFLLADMPVDQLDVLSTKVYIVKLDTAEQSLQPLSDQPKGG